MTRPQVKLEIDKIVIDQLGLNPDDQLTDRTRFVEDLHADSLDSAEMIMKIEEKFDIQIIPTLPF